MKKLLALLAVGLLGLGGFAQGYFVGVEIVPHTFGTATYGISYVTVGWADGPGFAYVGLSAPLTPLSSWYMVNAGGAYWLTENLSIRGVVSVWGLVDSFTLANGTWSIGVGPVYKIDQSLSFYLIGHLPLQVDPKVPYFGVWVSLGFNFYFGSEVKN